jgi:hypothetical protein
MNNDQEILRTAYYSYLDNAYLHFKQLNTAIQLWDGTKVFNETCFPDYDIQKFYNENPMELNPIRDLISDRFNNLEKSIKKVRHTFGDIEYDQLEDMELVENISAQLRELHSYVVVSNNMYFKNTNKDFKGTTEGIYTVCEEISKIEKDIEKTKNISDEHMMRFPIN